jgi:phage repressor protein C with HTH and peptisase S24 domain
VRTRSGETLAKELDAITSRMLLLTSVNPAYPARELQRQDIVWMARIIWVSQ